MSPQSARPQSSVTTTVPLGCADASRPRPRPRRLLVSLRSLERELAPDQGRPGRPSSVSLRRPADGSCLPPARGLRPAPAEAFRDREQRLRTIALVGFLQIGVSYACVFTAEQWIDSGLTALLFSSFAIWVAVLGHFLLAGEPLTARTIVATLAGIAGVAVIEGPAVARAGSLPCPARSPWEACSSSSAPSSPRFRPSSSRSASRGSRPLRTSGASRSSPRWFCSVPRPSSRGPTPSLWTPGTVFALGYLAVVGTFTFLGSQWLIPRLPVAVVGNLPDPEHASRPALGKPARPRADHREGGRGRRADPLRRRDGDRPDARAFRRGAGRRGIGSIPCRRFAGRRLVIYLFLCAVWGSTWLVIKIGLRDLPPLRFAGFRMALACALLAPVALSSAAEALAPRDSLRGVLRLPPDRVVVRPGLHGIAVDRVRADGDSLRKLPDLGRTPRTLPPAGGAVDAAGSGGSRPWSFRRRRDRGACRGAPASPPVAEDCWPEASWSPAPQSSRPTPTRSRRRPCRAFRPSSTSGGRR